MTRNPKRKSEKKKRMKLKKLQKRKQTRMEQLNTQIDLEKIKQMFTQTIVSLRCKTLGKNQRKEEEYAIEEVSSEEDQVSSEKKSS